MRKCNRSMKPNRKQQTRAPGPAVGRDAARSRTMNTITILTLAHRFERLLAALSVLEEEARSTRTELEQEVNHLKHDLGLLIPEPEVEVWWQHFECRRGLAEKALVLHRINALKAHWLTFMMLYDRIGKPDPKYALAALELYPKQFPSEPGDPSLN